MPVPIEIPDTVVKKIARGFAIRKINRLLTSLRNWIDVMPKLQLPQKNAAAMLAFYAWAMDMAPDFVPVVEKLVQRFKKEIPKGSMTLRDMIYLNMADGLINLHYEVYEEAINKFTLAEFGATHAEDSELQIVAWYYLGRSYLKTANYKTALSYMQQSKALDQLSGQPKRAAVTKSIEGLVHLLLGGNDVAEILFDEAEAVLKGNENDNAEVHGNLCMFRARIKRRQGNYDAAENKYKEGITFYEKRDRDHRNIARACVHLAVIKRILALGLEKEKVHGDEEFKLKQAKMRSYWGEALGYLSRAEKIYAPYPDRNNQGLAKVHITRALLYLDMGLYRNGKYFGDSEREARTAFNLGEQKRDNLVISKARTIQCRLALLDSHEERKEGKERDLRAINFANEAVSSAEETEYPRLQARAYIWQGQARLKILRDPSGAKKCLIAASHLLSSEDRDSLRDELEDLKEEIEGFEEPTTPIVTLTLSDLIKPISKDIGEFIAETKSAREKGDPQTARNSKPETKCYFRQIMDEAEEDAIRHLHGFMGSVHQVHVNWHVNAQTVRAAISTYTLTKSSLQDFERYLTDAVLKDTLDRKEKSLANKKSLAKLRLEILKGLAKLENQEVLGEAKFIGMISKEIGYLRAVALKPIIRKCVERQRERAVANGESL